MSCTWSSTYHRQALPVGQHIDRRQAGTAIDATSLQRGNLGADTAEGHNHQIVVGINPLTLNR